MLGWAQPIESGQAMCFDFYICGLGRLMCGFWINQEHVQWSLGFLCVMFAL